MDDDRTREVGAEGRELMGGASKRWGASRVITIPSQLSKKAMAAVVA